MVIRWNHYTWSQQYQSVWRKHSSSRTRFL